MNTKVILGQLRELLTIIGALCFTMLPTESMGSIVGAIVAAVAIVFAVLKHDGVESLFTLIRKFLSVLPAIGVQFGWIDAGVATKLIAGLAPISALVWSYLVNGGAVSGPIPGFKLLLALCCLAPFLPSCSTQLPEQGLRSPLTGVVYKNNAKGVVTPIVDSETTGKWFNGLLTLLNGGTIKEAILPPIIVEPTK